MMQQFIVKNEPISWDDFVTVYQKHYFIGYQSKLIKSNFQSSRFVEDKIENILKNGLTPDDLPLVVAWKLGNIDHTKSVKSVVFINNCDINLVFKTRGYPELDCSEYFGFIRSEFQQIADLAKENPKEAFNLLNEKSPKGFGPTYVLTLLFFFTNGKQPIYDKFAFLALLAINGGTVPFPFKQKVIGYKDINYGDRGWNIYEHYCNLLVKIAGDNFKERPVDRALWVYGHSFER